MAIRRPGVRALGAMAAVGLAATMITLAGVSAADAATVTCPTAGPGGVVTPAPAGRVDWSGCNLTGANLSGADLSAAYLLRTTLANANLAGADLDRANLQMASLASADLSGASLHHTGLKAANLSGTNFSGAILYQVFSGLITAGIAPTLPTGWQRTSGYFAGPTAYLGHAAPARAHLPSADLAGAFPAGAPLISANLSGADLSTPLTCLAHPPH